MNGRNAIYAVILVKLLSGCVNEGRHVVVEERGTLDNNKAVGVNNEVQSIALKNRDFEIQRAERYLEIARTSSNEAATDATLNAAEYYVQAHESQRAEQTVLALKQRKLTPVQLVRYHIVRAYAEYERGENTVPLARLEPILADSDTQLQPKVDALLLKALIYQRLYRLEDTINLLVEREALLFGEARAETSRYIWQVIEQISRPERLRVMANTVYPQVRTRLEQSLTGNVETHLQQPIPFEQWRHQRSATSANQSPRYSTWTASSPRSIAVLLPETSRYKRAAQAVKDGIMYQHALNASAYQPIINFYDIGSNPWQTTEYYFAASQSGHDVIIGPLGKDYADSVAQSLAGRNTPPTILLGGDHRLNSNTIRLGLSPEKEAQQAATYAKQLGLVNAVILTPNTTAGKRGAEAFSTFWLRSGGKISRTMSYSPRQYDHSTEFELLFELNKSKVRYRAFSDTLGFRPKFSPYRRRDIDFIYLVGDVDLARIMRPQINFFAGNQLPVIATSSIYNGIEAEAENRDLDNTLFPAMPWELAPQQVSPYAGQLNRLFALGSDAYKVAGEFENLKSHAPSLFGNTGTLRLSNTGELSIEPVWAKFENGRATTQAELRATQNPSSLNYRNGLDAKSTSGLKRYDESNWDSRKSRRKTGS